MWGGDRCRQTFLVESIAGEFALLLPSAGHRSFLVQCTILFTFGMTRITPELEVVTTSLSCGDGLVLVSLNAHVSRWFRISTNKEVTSYVVQNKPQHSLVAFNKNISCLCDNSACLALMKLFR